MIAAICALCPGRPLSTQRTLNVQAIIATRRVSFLRKAFCCCVMMPLTGAGFATRGAAVAVNVSIVFMSVLAEDSG